MLANKLDYRHHTQMKVTMAMVMSLDGKTTRGKESGTADWASPEDQSFFREIIASHDCVVMGSATYRAAREHMRPSADKPRIILSSNPGQYADEGHEGLFFMAAKPNEVIKKAAAMACSNVLLAGGAATNAEFLEAGLVDEAYVTIEPLLLGSGRPLTTGLTSPIDMRLITAQQLNEAGTMLLHYEIIKPANGGQS